MKLKNMYCMHDNRKFSLVLTAIAIFFVSIQNVVSAQDCDKLVRPLFAQTPDVYDNLPQPKMDYYCNFAQNSFYWANRPPQNAHMYDISAVKNKATGENLLQDIEIDLDTFSYFAYNFEEFQYQHYYEETYFKVGSGKKVKYLVLRHYNDIHDRCLILEKANANRKNQQR